MNVKPPVTNPTVLFAFWIPLAAADTNVCADVFVDGALLSDWIWKVLPDALEIGIHLLWIGSPTLG